MARREFSQAQKEQFFASVVSSWSAGSPRSPTRSRRWLMVSSGSGGWGWLLGSISTASGTH